MSIIHDIDVNQGAIKVVQFVITVLTDPLLPFDETSNPRIPLDLTTAALQCQVRSSYNTSTVDITATDLNGRIVKTDAVNGEFELRIGPDDTTAIRFNEAVKPMLYDIEAKFSANNKVRVAQGAFNLSRAITRIS